MVGYNICCWNVGTGVRKDSIKRNCDRLQIAHAQDHRCRKRFYVFCFGHVFTFLTFLILSAFLFLKNVGKIGV